MTAQPLTEAEARIVAAFDAAPPAPESYACTCGHEGLTAEWHADTCGRTGPVTADRTTRDQLAAALAEHEPRYRSSYATGEPDWFECGPASGEPACDWRSDPESDDIGTDHRAHVADDLLPVVDRLAAERAAAELRAAADWFVLDDDERGPSYHAPDGHPYYEAEFWAAGHLRARADALDPS